MLTKLPLMLVKQNLLCLVHLKKQLDRELKLKLNGKKLYQADSFKYLGIHLDKYVTWKHQINSVATKLNKANAIISKIRHYVDIKTFKNKFIMQFLNHIYLMLHWFECKIHHLLKDNIFY